MKEKGIFLINPNSSIFKITSSRVLCHLKERISREEDQYHPQIINDIIIIKSVGQNAGVLKRLKTQFKKGNRPRNKWFDNNCKNQKRKP